MTIGELNVLNVLILTILAFAYNKFGWLFPHLISNI